MKIAPEMTTVLEPAPCDNCIWALRCGAQQMRSHVRSQIWAVVYFGWPNALEDAPGRALTAALEMLAAVRTALGEGPLGIRLGVATSEAVTRTAAPSASPTAASATRPAVIGEAPSLATQILPKVPLNGVLVAESTRRLTGASFEFILAGTLDGHADEPSLLWRLLSARPVLMRFRAAHAGLQSSVIGRREELALLMSRWRLRLQGEAPRLRQAGSDARRAAA